LISAGTHRGTAPGIQSGVSPARASSATRIAMRLPPEAVGHPGHGGGDDLGILVGIAADLVLATVDLAAQRGALQQDVFQPEAEALLGDIRWRRQLELGLLDPERPFQRLLHAHGALDLAARPRWAWTCGSVCDRSCSSHTRSRRRSTVTSPRASIASRMVLLIVLGGRNRSEFTRSA
jgi:hypothetical protein